MILHLNLDTPSDLLAQSAKQMYARYYRTEAHYVYVLDASVKEVPPALRPYVSYSLAVENNCQLSSREYQSSLRSIDLGDDLRIDDQRTLLVAGPCSVEDEAQLEEVAEHLQGLGLRYIRAGSYKPRTAPYSFQGLGARGLELLTHLRSKYGLRIVTEARDATHIDQVIEHSDIIQIGAKAMFDQGILRACAETQKPILIKRSFGATLQEFIQASEFILCAGNNRVILCERGIRSFEQKTRFTLDLCGVAYLKQHTNLPIFIDPSHAMGHAYGVPALSRAAVAMGVEGLLIEAHPNPPRALSDAEQQLDLPTLSELHASLLPIAAAVGRKIM